MAWEKLKQIFRRKETGVVHATYINWVEAVADAQDVRANIARIMDDVWSTISFAIGRKNREDVDHELFENDDAWQITQGANAAAWKLTSLRDMAGAQLEAGITTSTSWRTSRRESGSECILTPVVWATRSPRGF